MKAFKRAFVYRIQTLFKYRSNKSCRPFPKKGVVAFFGRVSFPCRANLTTGDTMKNCAFFYKFDVMQQFQ